MKEIKEYQLLQSNSVTTLSMYVNDAISKGWVPFGSPMITSVGKENSSGTKDSFIQAVIKY